VGSCLFKYYNANPQGKKHTTDCVIRAVSLVSGRKYESVKKGLIRYKDITCADVYNNAINTWEYVQSIGGVWKRTGGKIKVKEFAAAHPDGGYVLDMKDHYSALINGSVYDTWDTRSEDLLAYAIFPEARVVPPFSTPEFNVKDFAEYIRRNPYMRTEVQKRLHVLKSLLRDYNTNCSNELYAQADNLFKLSE
jgi:hypothetical protein